MKSILNIPVIKTDIVDSKERHKRFLAPSVILKTWDKLFGDGYELYEHNYRHLITKDLGQCYRFHAEFTYKYPAYKYLINRIRSYI